MCGIFGYTGYREATPLLLKGLRKLEYRGYDSSGIAVKNGNETSVIIKAEGKTEKLTEKIKHSLPKGTLGIGHTRWATHGAPSEKNAHPHRSADGNVIGVHNGILENHREFKDILCKEGIPILSETDTEVAIQWIAYLYQQFQDPLRALTQAMKHFQGSYAMVLIFSEHPHMLFAIRKDNPLFIGKGEKEHFLSSDIPAILQETRTVFELGNQEIAAITREDISFYDQNGNNLNKTSVTIPWNAGEAEKGDFPNFMLKEIYEQPKTIRNTLHSLLSKDISSLLGLSSEEIQNIQTIHIVACGSAYHVGIAAQYGMETLTRIPVRVEYASEFRYRNPILNPNDLVIIISQSGETADSLAALREVKKRNVRTLAIVNTAGSGIAREADHTILTPAGPEIAVATTKAYSAQLLVCNFLAIIFAKEKALLSDETYQNLLSELQSIPEKIEKILSHEKGIALLAHRFLHASDAFFIGRGLDFAIALEGSLKMKEISYIHSEAYTAGELKHGTISLIEKNTLSIGILTQKHLLEKTKSNLIEMKSRGAYLALFTTYDNQDTFDFADFIFPLPEIHDLFAASLAVIPLQLLGYHFCMAKGFDVDHPRNLAKSVTVE